MVDFKLSLSLVQIIILECGKQQISFDILVINVPKIMLFSRKSDEYLCYFEQKVMIFYIELIILFPVEEISRVVNGGTCHVLLS